MKTLKYLFLFAAVLFAACEDSDFTYSKYRNNFRFDNSVHGDATLNSAMNAQSPGVFCRISYQLGSKQFLFANNQGAQTICRINAVDEERFAKYNQSVGMNNGLIVGYGNLADGEFFAYDLMCPNCYDFMSNPRNYPLSMDAAGIASCDNCHRRYNMNTGGNSLDGGTGMTRYSCNRLQPLGILSVQ